MKCSKCGAELPEGSLYCNQCGKEIQIVKDDILLEDDYLRSVLEETPDLKSRDSSSSEDLEEDSGEEEIRRRNYEKAKRKKQQLQKKKRRNRIILLVILCLAVGFVLGFWRYESTHSVSYLLNKAQEAYDQSYYSETLEYTEEVLAKDADNVDALMLEGNTYLLMKEEENAENAFLKVISIDNDNVEAYQNLLDLYQSQKDYDKIVALQTSTSDTDILELIQSYIIQPPVFSEESGEYSEYFELEITADSDDVDIYYTLDGTVPTKSSDKYTEPISIEEEGSITVTAVCISKSGFVSEAAVADYEITLAEPDQPTANPDGGEFEQETKVYISAPDDCEIYYSWTNSEPDENSTKYSGPITIPEGNNVLYVVAISENGKSSKVLKCNYIYYPQTEDPLNTEQQTVDTESNE